MLKNVCIQGLGFVGAAMAVAVASARSTNGEALYSVVGVDQDTPEGCERVRKLGKGEFPFPTLDNSLLEKVKECYSRGNLISRSSVKLRRSSCSFPGWRRTRIYGGR